MKKLPFLLFLIITKTVFGQSFFIGGTGFGVVYYQLRQLPSDDHLEWPINLCGQFLTRKNDLGIELNLLAYVDGVPDPNLESPSANVTVSGYLLYNVFHQYDGVMLQLKAGTFVSHFALSGEYAFNDLGPAVGIYLALPIAKKAYLGFDLNEMIGVNTKLLPDAKLLYDGLSSGPIASTQISYTCYLIKFIYKI